MQETDRCSISFVMPNQAAAESRSRRKRRSKVPLLRRLDHEPPVAVIKEHDWRKRPERASPTDLVLECEADEADIQTQMKENEEALHLPRSQWTEHRIEARVWGWNHCDRIQCVNLRSGSGSKRNYVQYSGKDLHLMAVTRTDYVDLALLYHWWSLLLEGGYVHTNAYHAFLKKRYRQLQASYANVGHAFMSEAMWYDATWAFVESLEIVDTPIDPALDSCVLCGIGQCRVGICYGCAATMNKKNLHGVLRPPSENLIQVGHNERLQQLARRLQCRLDDANGKKFPHSTKLNFSKQQRSAMLKLGVWAKASANNDFQLEADIVEQMSVLTHSNCPSLEDGHCWDGVLTDLLQLCLRNLAATEAHECRRG